MSFSQLSAFLETKILRCLLVMKAHREKYSLTLWGLQSKVIRVNKSIHEGGMEINPLREKYDALKVIT